MPTDRLTDRELQILVDDPDFTPEVRAKLTPEEHVRMSAILDAKARSQPPSRMSDTLTALGTRLREGILKMPGAAESAGALPGNLLGMARVTKPLSIPLAALGGSLGELYAQLRGDHPLSSEDVAGAALRQGAGEAGPGLAGNIIGRGMLSTFGLPRGTTGANTAIMSMRPYATTRGELAGARSARDALGRAIDARVGAIPGTIPMTEALEGHDALIGKISPGARPITTQESAETHVQDILNEHPAELNPLEALQTKRNLDKDFQIVEAARQRGVKPPPDAAIDNLLRGNLAQSLTSRDPGRWYQPPLQQLNRHAGERIEAARALNANSLHPETYVGRRLLLGAALSGGADVINRRTGGANLPEELVMGAGLYGLTNPLMMRNLARLAFRTGDAAPALANIANIAVRRRQPATTP